MAVTTFSSVAELAPAVGSHLGHSTWHEITQERVNTFADATDDHQFIHVDPDRAAETMFGGPIAHGFLTLSLSVPLVHEVFEVKGVRVAVNYGLNRVRFPAPVPVGSRIRVGVRLASVEEIPGGVQVTVDAEFEIEGGTKPACVAQLVSRYYL
jgi:acyl dehydratase